MNSTPLALDPEEFRKLGYQVIDMLAAHYGRLAGEPVWRPSETSALDAALALPFRDEPRPFGELLELFEKVVIPNTVRTTHPRFFGFVPVPGNPLSVLGELMADGVNVFAGSWQSGAAAAVIERRVIRWLAGEVGLPESSGGIMVSGGSQANLTALAVALEKKCAGAREKAVAYFSDQTHSAVERALRVLGVPHQRKLPSNERGQLDARAVRAELAKDRANHLQPFCLIANAGTTSTGAVDPLAAMADFCATEGLWLHADAAYGGAAVLCPEGREALKGLERVDSLALDPHKWLFQPAGSGCVLVRRDADLVETFQILPDYLRDVYRIEQNRNYCDRGIELTRPFRALALWVSLQGFGIRAFREAVSRGFELSRRAAAARSGQLGYFDARADGDPHVPPCGRRRSGSDRDHRPATRRWTRDADVDRGRRPGGIAVLHHQPADEPGGRGFDSGSAK